MWFLYVEGHGIWEYDEEDKLEEAVKEWLESHRPDAITVIEGKDITSEVIRTVRR